MTVVAPRSLLAVPASSERLLRSAPRRGADALMLDLEDGVAADEKDAARGRLVELLGAHRADLPPSWVRVNDPLSPHGEEDLRALEDLRARGPGDGPAAPPAGLVVPGATPEVVAAAARRTDLPLLALVETARGVEQAADVAAHPAVVGVLFGQLDYVRDVSRHGGWHLTDLGWVASRLVNAAAAGEAWCLAGPFTDLDDGPGLVRSIAEDRARGFAGKLCIHPTQIVPVNDGFGPSAEQLAWARRVLAAADESDGAARVGGQMVDRPVVQRARDLLAAGGRGVRT